MIHLDIQILYIDFHLNKNNQIFYNNTYNFLYYFDLDILITKLQLNFDENITHF